MHATELDKALALSPPVLQDHVARIEQSLRAAVDEIARLRGVIDSHTRAASGHLVSNTEVAVASVIDIEGLRTRVRTSPRLYEFYLAEPLGGWSKDHKQEFHKQVIRGFAEREADQVARSIWTAEER